MTDQPAFTVDPAAILHHTLVEIVGQEATDPASIANEIMLALAEQGHVIPHLPPAKEILADAELFAEQLILANLALRIVRMVILTGLETSETEPARRFIRDYLDGKNHGPAGKAMLWPARLPGLAGLLRQWGFEPTPTEPQYVARVPDNVKRVVMQ